jgi:hypothetical protein
MIVSATAKHLTAIAAALGLMVASTSTATGRADGIHFVAGAHRVVQGNEVSVSVSVSPAGVRCSASVRYKGGKTQNLSTVAAIGGRASWNWRVARSTTPGPARINVACGPAGRASRTLAVIGAVLPPAIRVVKSGWSVRPMMGAGSSVSYGVILANESRTRDALDVKVLVNFVMEDNRLIGSATTKVADIAAGTQHAMGGDLMFPGGAPIARLEIVATTGGAGPATRTFPGLSAVRVMPSPWEPSWAGSVEGELQNDDPALTLSRAELSTVVLDTAGNVIGGGHGNAFTPIPPSTRLFFKINQGLRAIPIGKAATALVSVVPTYDKAGT